MLDSSTQRSHDGIPRITRLCLLYPLRVKGLNVCVGLGSASLPLYVLGLDDPITALSLVADESCHLPAEAIDVPPLPSPHQVYRN
jgi:hypothetical protein